MNKTFETMEIFNAKKLPLSGGRQIYFFSASAEGLEDAKAHFDALNSISKMRLVGPELYAACELPLFQKKSSGEFLFLGTEVGGGYRGLQCCLVSEDISKEIVFEGRRVGLCFEDDFARYALLGGIFPEDIRACKEAQTSSVFESIEAALDGVGMDFSNIVRTWFYNDNILDWYEIFNRARDSFFESRKVFSGLVPASTGIGSRNARGAALAARAFAVKPKSELVKICEVESPLQCSARDYRSSFSRAVEITHPNFRHLIVSGTAGIEYGGKSAFVGDLDRQINLSLDVAEAILKSRGMDWDDTLRAAAYIKDFSCAGEFRKIQKKRGLEKLPCVAIQADVCRDDLLFEIELDAGIALKV